MYEWDTIGCPEYVSHPGQLCLRCEQRERDEEELEEELEGGWRY